MVWPMRPRSGAADEPATAGDVIGVIVRLDHVDDASTRGAGELEVDVDVPARVHHDRLTAVGQQVGGTAKLVVQDLMEAHQRSPVSQ